MFLILCEASGSRKASEKGGNKEQDKMQKKDNEAPTKDVLKVGKRTQAVEEEKEKQDKRSDLTVDTSSPPPGKTSLL